MGLVDFLKFAFKCFDLLAWPLFGLGCPLYASIRAIENNSNSEMRNLVAYWIIFSLVSLFELAFVKLIDWLPFWPYMKLMAMCLLVLPDCNGASYVYECLLRLCLYVDPRAAIKYFIKPKEEKLFLALAERYVQENGSEALEKALEKLLDRESKHTKPDIGVEEIKAMTNTEEKGTAIAIQSKYEEPNVGKWDARAVEQPEKSPVAATKLSNVEEPSVGKENAAMGQLKDESAAVATEQGENTKAKFEELIAGKQVNNKGSSSSAASPEPKKTLSLHIPNVYETKKPADKVEVNRTNDQYREKKSKHTKPDIGVEVMKALTFTEEKEIAPAIQSKVKEPYVNKENANAGELKDESPAVATEQVKCVELNLATKEKKTVATGEIKEKTVATAVGESKAVEITDSEKVQREWTCTLCQVTATSEKIFDSHLQGRKHKAQELRASKQVNENEGSSSLVATPEPEETLSIDRLNEDGTKKQEYKFQCTICDVKMHNEIAFVSHLGGKKHLSKTRQHINDTLGGGFY
ncbi:hypothetical protein RHMOL_Rhmol11G0213300 [Rhododendron molle]|uniref:Uncharacterized protein n=1 Tax=Rhododendron molle TaxID=49168 RepID=A0ACC0LUX6_RHOML|nr:hypothetical protein RHMOL_Rhmol11G0213300 [Rhododendron molle]